MVSECAQFTGLHEQIQDRVPTEPECPARREPQPQSAQGYTGLPTKRCFKFNNSDSERYTKSLALEMKSEYASQNKKYPYSSSTDGYSSTVDSNKDNYVEMAPAPLENDYIVKEPKLEKRFTDIPFIAKELVRRESLKGLRI